MLLVCSRYPKTSNLKEKEKEKEEEGEEEGEEGEEGPLLDHLPQGSEKYFPRYTL